MSSQTNDWPWIKNNQVTELPVIVLQVWLADHGIGKIESPPAMNQAAGAKQSGPHNNYVEDLIQSIHNASILAATKLEIMQCAVAKIPKVSISAHGIQIPFILDSGSEVTLLRQSYFDQHLLPKLNW